MANFAEIDHKNVVIRVLVVPNSEEHRGEEFLANDLGLGGRWIQTSYNGNIRVRYAGKGYRYDELRDAFIAPQPFMSWVFNEETLDWQAPVPYPDDEKLYYWDESTGEWKIADAELN